MNQTDVKKQYSISVLKFIVLSMFGVFSFFIKFPFNGTNSILIDHIVSLVRPIVGPHYILEMFIFGMFCIIDTWFIRKSWKKGTVNKVLSIVTTIGAILAAMIYFNIGPSWFLAKDIGPNASILNGIASITIIIAGVFITFLIDFGLVDAVGVLVRPLMRPVFKVPGRASVIAISGFLGNFSIGHISTNKLYKEGKFNKREAATIALAFCTPSLGIVILMSNFLGMMEYWNLIFGTSVIVTLLVSFIAVRIYPLRNKPLDYYESVTPNPEPEIHEKLLQNSFESGVRTAENSGSIAKKLGTTFLFTLRAATNMMVTGVLVLTVGLLLDKYTSIFTYVGYVFWPFLKVMGFQNLDVLIKCVSMNFVDMYLSVLIGVGADLALKSKFFVAVYPMTVAIFVSGFWPMVLSTELPVKPLDLAVSWVIRMVLSIIFIGIAAMIFF